MFVELTAASVVVRECLALGVPVAEEVAGGQGGDVDPEVVSHGGASRAVTVGSTWWQGGRRVPRINILREQ